jgi:hypothetical protein
MIFWRIILSIIFFWIDIIDFFRTTAVTISTVSALNSPDMLLFQCARVG